MDSPESVSVSTSDTHGIPATPVAPVAPAPLDSVPPIAASIPVNTIWSGSKVPLARAALDATANPGSSFMISATTYKEDWGIEWPIPISGGGMNWFLSTTQANDPTQSDYTQTNSEFMTSPPPAFNSALVSALQSQGANPQLAIFIHGLGTLLPDAYWGMASLGANLVQFASYPGLVIGFDWPSYGESSSGVYYSSIPYSFPPQNTSGTIRDNINGTVEAFGYFMSYIETLKNNKGLSNLSVSIVCHSEGNYMAMLGMMNNQPPAVVDHIVMLAADINNGAFINATNATNNYVGQGAGISNTAKDVTVYFSNNDDVLPLSDAAYLPSPNSDIQTLFKGIHNPLFSGRLGLSGPAYNQGAQFGNVSSVDCSGVINLVNFQLLENDGVINPNQDNSTLTMHTSYLFIPQVLQDISAVLTGTAPPNRSKAANTNAYIMGLNNSNNG